MRVDVTSSTEKPKSEPVKMLITLTQEELQTMFAILQRGMNFFPEHTSKYQLTSTIECTIKDHLKKS